MNIAFASCMDAYRMPDQPVWVEISRRQPDVLLLLGDQIYMDWGDLGESNWKQGLDRDLDNTLPKFAAEMHARYQRQWEVASFQNLIVWMVSQRGPASVQITWDDHDFAWNNSVGLPETGAVHHGVSLRVKNVSKRLFRQFVAHLTDRNRPDRYPAYDEAALLNAPDEHDGIQYFGKLVAGHETCDFAMLDTRWYRTDRGQDNPEILGAAQFQGFVTHLRERGGLMIAAAGTPMKYRYSFSPQAWCAPPGGHSYIEFEKFVGAATDARRPVLFLSGDVHRNSWGGLVRLAATAESSVVQVISSGAAIGRIGPKKFPPRFGWLSIQQAPAGTGTVSISLLIRQAAGWVPEIPDRVIRYDAHHWLDARDGEAAADQPFIDPASFDDVEPFPLLVLRTRVDQAWPASELSVTLDDLEPVESAYRQKIVDLSQTIDYLRPDPCEVSAAPYAAGAAARMRIRFAGDMHTGTNRNNEIRSLIVAAFERALAKAGRSSVTLFVHGTGTGLPDVIDHAYHLRALFNTEPVAFAWPSGKGGGGLAAYIGGVAAIRQADACFLPMQGVLRIFNEVSGLPQYADVAKVLLCRSTGTHLFDAALAVIGAGQPGRQEHFGHLTRIVLSSPMAKASRMHELARHGAMPPIVVTVNTSDQTLNFADKIDGWGPMLGFDLPTTATLAQGVTYLNFTGAGRLHDYLLPTLSQAQSAINHAFFSLEPLRPDAIVGIVRHGPDSPVFDVP